MADFRKWFLAFAVLALVTSLAVPASAQTTTPSLQCVANAGVPPTIRAEGLTELVGDVVLNCTGGIPTTTGANVPAANISIFLTTNVTSRLTSNPFVEALLLIDEPHTPNNPTTPIVVCDPTNGSNGVCTVLGTGLGATTYSGGKTNTWQGRLTGANQVTFNGVPIDPPGTSGTRTIRITNVRVDATRFQGASPSGIPFLVTEFISVTGSTALPINNPQQTVAYVQPGLKASSTTVKFLQCQSANLDLFNKPSATPTTPGQFSVSFTEGFPSAFKEKNIAIHLANTGFAAATPTLSYPADAAQDVPGSVYFSESGLEVNGVTPNNPSTPPPGFGPFLTANPSLPSVRGLPGVGVADAGTRIIVQFASVPQGSLLFIPGLVYLTNPAITGSKTGIAVLTSTNSSGGGSFTQVSAASNGLAPVSLSGGAGTAVYEVLYDDPFNVEALTIPVTVAYSGTQGNNLPTPGAQSTVAGSFAPISAVNTSSDFTVPIPRFSPSTTPLNSFIINKCNCNILFPYVTNQLGYDTGVAISNTSADPFSAGDQQQGLITLNYYGPGTPPSPQTTQNVVLPGQQLLFTLSGGSPTDPGIKAITPFTGYIIAQAQFQYCHAFAYLSALGAGATSPGASESYLGIILDAPTLNRTGVFGENVAH